MSLPSDDDLRLELNNLSAHLYGCIDREGDLAPTREEWDKYRDRVWSQSRSLLRVFGLPVNRVGWGILVEAYGFLNPTLSEAKRGSNQRRRDSVPHIPYFHEVDIPGLVGDISREEVYRVDNHDGTYTKTTRTYISLR